MISPANVAVDMPIEGGYVGMVDRDTFDEWLRQRAREAGADLRQGTFQELVRDTDGTAVVRYQPRPSGAVASIRARCVIGADGANSAVAKQCIPGAEKIRYVP
jgi:geranylgeranyl reductase